MKQLAGKIAFVVIVLCAVAATYLHYGQRGAVVATAQFPAATPQTPAPRTTGAVGTPAQPAEAFPLDRSRTVELAADKPLLAELTARERRDQYLDWLLLTALSELVPSSDELNRATFDLPAVRYGYMRPVANFEYGETRSRFIGNGTVLALIPARADSNARKDFLAHVADEHRKTLGAMFDRLMVLDYDLRADQPMATLTRRADIPAATLFSSDYGYFEQKVADAKQLAAFLGKIDDLTAVVKTNEGLTLAGRKILGRKYRGISAEEIAAVWQAEHKILVALDAFDSRADSKFDAFNSRWSSRTYRTQYERAELERERDAELDQLRASIAAEREGLHLIDGSGFSLDPTYDYKGLADQLTKDAPLFDLKPPDLQSITQSLNDKARGDRRIVPLLQLIDKLERSAESGNPVDARKAGLLSQAERTYRFQAARYDGDLQGTETGMILFYTDLLAKLWVIDFVRTAPVQQIVDFRDGPNVQSSLIYKAENQELRSGRLWFGQSDLGFQVAGRDSSVLFARIATRVYSAGHNPLNPGVETETSVGIGTPIVWWNDHYEEIARYEQEYERLNEVMKWSVVISWLNAHGDGDKLGYLADLKVDRSKRLPSWVQAHSDLRFNKWTDVGFYPDGFKGTTTEALPLLAGTPFDSFGELHQLSGGVTLASKSTLSARTTVLSSIEKTALRSNIDYAAQGVGRDLIKTLDKSSFAFAAPEPNVASVVAKAKPEAKLRATTAELANKDIQRVITRSDDAARLETRADSVPIGDLEIARTENGFRAGWQSRELDAAQSMARQMSSAADPMQVLARNPDVTDIIRLSGDTDIAVRLRGSQDWLRFAKEQKPSKDLPAGWQMRVADINNAQRNFYVQAVGTTKLQNLITHGHVVIDGLGDGGKVLLHIADDVPPTTVHIFDVDAGDVSLKVWVDPQNGAVHIVTPLRELPGDFAAVMRRFGPEDFAAVRAAASRPPRPGVAPVKLRPESVTRGRLETAQAAGDFREMASDVAADATAARKAIDREVVSALDANDKILSDMGTQEAILHLDGLVRAYGSLPELTLRRGLLNIDRGLWREATTSLGRAPRPMRGRERFFDEINFRLKDSARPARARENLLRYAEEADFQDAVLTHRDLGDAVLPEYRDDTFDFSLRLGKAPDLSPASVDLAKVRDGTAVIYHQDVPGLNNLDWNVAIDRTLQQVIEGRLGKVVRLPRGDVAHFKPAAIYHPDPTVTFQKAGPHLHPPRIPSSYSSCDPNNNTCSSQTASNNSAEQVYLVMAN
jgi:hypothetical protein